MLPDPLHPAVVHLPIALALLVPGLAVLLVAAIQWELLPPRSWALIALLQIALVGSAWLAIETGERDEPRVEHVVAESHIESHEEAGERFLLLAGVALIALGAGLIPGRTGAVARAVGTLAALGVLASAVSVGHTGGELVYKHGAASAYAEPRDPAAR